MSAAAFNEHAVVRTNVAVTSDATILPPGLEGYIVHVYRTAPNQEREYMVEIVIVDDRGVQVDGWLVDVKHSDLTLVPEAMQAAPVRRFSETLPCIACACALRVTWERPPAFATVVTHAVRCPACRTIIDDAAPGAMYAPVVKRIGAAE